MSDDGEFVAVTLSQTFNYDLDMLEDVGINPDDTEQLRDMALEDMASLRRLDNFDVKVVRSDTITKAEPFPQWDHHRMGTACQHCGQPIQTVAQGRWCHIETQVFFCRDHG